MYADAGGLGSPEESLKRQLRFRSQSARFAFARQTRRIFDHATKPAARGLSPDPTHAGTDAPATDSLSYARLHMRSLFEEQPYADARKARSAVARQVRADHEATLDMQVRDPLAARLKRLGLQANVAEVHAQGYTVIRSAFSREWALETRQSIHNFLSEQREHWRKEPKVKVDIGSAGRMLTRGRQFEEAALNGKLWVLNEALLGRGHQLFSLAATVRGHGTQGLTPHSDMGLPLPWPVDRQGADLVMGTTAIFVLDPEGFDAAGELGGSTVVPGSNRLRRYP